MVVEGLASGEQVRGQGGGRGGVGHGCCLPAAVGAWRRAAPVGGRGGRRPGGLNHTREVGAPSGTRVRAGGSKGAGGGRQSEVKSLAVDAAHRAQGR